jgi:general secretion pathway protein J
LQEGDAVELTTLNGVSGTVQLERVRWRLEEGRLYRDVWPVIDSPADVKPEEVPIVSEVKSMQWRFYRRAGRKAGRLRPSAGRRGADADHGKRRYLALGVYDTGRYARAAAPPQPGRSAPAAAQNAPAPDANHEP